MASIGITYNSEINKVVASVSMEAIGNEDNLKLLAEEVKNSCIPGTVEITSYMGYCKLFIPFKMNPGESLSNTKILSDIQGVFYNFFQRILSERKKSYVFIEIEPDLFKNQDDLVKLVKSECLGQKKGIEITRTINTNLLDSYTGGESREEIVLDYGTTEYCDFINHVINNELGKALTDLEPRYKKSQW